MIMLVSPLVPYNDKLNGFFFVITPAGIQMEGTVTGGGSNDDSFSTFWDNKWYSKVVRYSDKWIAEMAIPFKSFRYKSNVREWNISMDRWELKSNRKTSWIQHPHSIYFCFFSLWWTIDLGRPDSSC